MNFPATRETSKPSPIRRLVTRGSTSCEMDFSIPFSFNSARNQALEDSAPSALHQTPIEVSSIGRTPTRLNKPTHMVRYSSTEASLVFDFYAATSFDFFFAVYFFMARRFFCLLRLCKFFRASCFMLILLVRRDKPAVVCGWEFRSGKG